MGPRGLNKFFKETNPNGISEVNLFTLMGKTVVIDTSIYLYRYNSNNELFENFYSGGELGQKGFRYIKEFLTKVPIPKNSKYQKDIIKLVDQINKPGVSKNEFKKILKEMNILVEKTYSLSEKERELINIHIKKI